LIALIYVNKYVIIYVHGEEKIGAAEYAQAHQTGPAQLRRYGAY